jgi:hypothetical protein
MHSIAVLEGKKIHRASPDSLIKPQVLASHVPGPRAPGSHAIVSRSLFRPVFARLAPALLAAVLPLAALAQFTPIPTLQPPTPGFDFPTQQTLTFDVDWSVFTAGTAVFHIDQQGAQERITATADSIGSTNLLFPVVDKFQSGFDTHTGCSTGFSKQLQEGRRRVTGDLTFNYPTGKQTQVEKNLVKGTSKTLTASIPACVTDSLSAIFYAASQPLVVGQNVRFPLADSMRTVTVVMKVEAREDIKTPAGIFHTLRVQPTAEEGVVKNRGNIWIWYSDDSRHIPVQIRARLFWGTITFHLRSYETH